jgi:hypothetical protein
MLPLPTSTPSSRRIAEPWTKIMVLVRNSKRLSQWSESSRASCPKVRRKSGDQGEANCGSERVYGGREKGIGK